MPRDAPAEPNPLLPGNSWVRLSEGLGLGLGEAPAEPVPRAWLLSLPGGTGQQRSAAWESWESSHSASSAGASSFIGLIYCQRHLPASRMPQPAPLPPTESLTRVPPCRRQLGAWQQHCRCPARRVPRPPPQRPVIALTFMMPGAIVQIHSVRWGVNIVVKQPYNSIISGAIISVSCRNTSEE